MRSILKVDSESLFFLFVYGGKSDGFIVFPVFLW